MEANLKELFTGLIEFLGVLVPGVLAYGLLLYAAPSFIKKLAPGEGAVSSLVIVLLVYVLGFVIYGLSGAYDLIGRFDLPWQRGQVAVLKRLESQFTNSPPAEVSLADEDKISGNVLYEWARAYIAFKQPDALRNFDHVRAEAKVCRSVSFFCLILSGWLIVCNRRARWWTIAWRAALPFMVALLFYVKYTQRDMEMKEHTFRYALIVNPVKPPPAKK